MPSIRPAPNRLLQALPAAELEALVPRLGFIERRSSTRHFSCNGGAARAGTARTGPTIRRMQCFARGRRTPGPLAVARAIHAAAKRCR
jgi:hypothetical protein